MRRHLTDSLSQIWHDMHVVVDDDGATARVQLYDSRTTEAAVCADGVAG